MSDEPVTSSPGQWNWLPSLVLVVLAVLVLVFAVNKSNANFEGSLTVSQMSFTAGGNNSGTSVLLNGIKGVQRVSVRGVQTLRLRGRFGDDATSRTIQWRTGEGEEELSFVPLETASSNLDLLSLTVSGGTRVARLERLPAGSGGALGMCLYGVGERMPTPQDDANCGSTPARTTTPGEIRLNVGSQGVRLGPGWRGLSQDALSGARPFRPDSPTVVIPIGDHASIRVELPRAQRSSEQWLWARGEVRDLSFHRLVETNFTQQGLGIEQTLVSTIASGSVRGFGASQTIKQLDILPGQFLLFGDGGEPGRRLFAGRAKLRSVALAPWRDKEALPVLAVALVGKETILRTGTDVDYPVAELWTSTLEQWFSGFPKELFVLVITGVAGFLGGFVQKALDRSPSRKSTASKGK